VSKGTDFGVSLLVGGLRFFRFFLLLIRIHLRRNLLHEEGHQLEQLLAGQRVLGRVGGDIFEGPLEILVLSKLTS